MALKYLLWLYLQYWLCLPPTVILSLRAKRRDGPLVARCEPSHGPLVTCGSQVES